MRSNLRAILMRVERMTAEVRQRAGEVDPASLVAILHAGRARAARGESEAITTLEQARERTRELRRRLVESGARSV